MPSHDVSPITNGLANLGEELAHWLDANRGCARTQIILGSRSFVHAAGAHAAPDSALALFKRGRAASPQRTATFLLRPREQGCYKHLPCWPPALQVIWSSRWQSGDSERVVLGRSPLAWVTALAYAVSRQPLVHGVVLCPIERRVW
jgi:hypothetical protein